MFNVPTFSIPGMMPTTHPVADSVHYTDALGAVNLEFSVTTVPPTTVKFSLSDYTGRRFFTDMAGDRYTRTGNSNAFVFGSETEGYLPVGSYWLHVLADDTLLKFPITNLDNPFSLGDNSAWPQLDVAEELVSDEYYLPGTYNWSATVTGDTFPGLMNIGITEGGAPPVSPILSARLQLRRIRGSTLPEDLLLSSGNGGILINSDADWNLSIVPFLVTLPPGTYYYDLEITSVDATVRTYLKGAWKVVADNTN